MSQTSREPPPTATSRDDAFARLDAPLPASERSPSGAWQGWAYFGAVVMAMMGLFWAVLGLIALFDDPYFVVRTDSLLAVHTFTPWGWVHLLGGLVAVGAGAGIMFGGHRWARVLGIVVAGLSAVANLGFLRVSPVWSTFLIALDVLVIYALSVHGWELDER